jgi:hypothetical protein
MYPMPYETAAKIMVSHFLYTKGQVKKKKLMKQVPDKIKKILTEQHHK